MNLDSTLVPTLDIAHKPLPGWAVTGGDFQYAYQDGDSVALGSAFEYAYGAWTAVGLARTAKSTPRLGFEPSDYRQSLGLFPELIYPTSRAESGANFLVINCWDAAAFTAGFAQLAAHTDDDLLPLFETLATRLPAEFTQWFPELRMVDGRLSYVTQDRYKPIGDAVAPRDGAPYADYYRGDFMGFFNPDRRKVDKAELHASARWIEWSRRSAAMRTIQVEISIENMKDSVHLLDKELRKAPSARFPDGVDKMRCDWLAAAIAVPHLKPSRVDLAAATLQAADPLEAFRRIEYGPGDREETVVRGVRARPILATLKFNRATMQPQ